MNRCRRSIFFIDNEVQGALLARTTIYWMFCLFAVSLMLICWNAYTGPSRRFVELVADLFNRYGPSLLASLILLPIALMDVLRFSNRFVGPVTRVRAALKDLAAGKPVERLQFRDEDFWNDLAGDINALSARLSKDQPKSPVTLERPKTTERVEATLKTPAGPETKLAATRQ